MKRLAFALTLILGSGFAVHAIACDCAKKSAKKECACAGGNCPAACPKDADKTAPKPDKTEKPKK